MHRNIFLFFSAIVLFSACQKSSKYIYNEGLIHGTIYHIIYESPQGVDFQEDIKKRMHAFDQSLSTFEPNSVISRINRNDPDVVVDDDFRTVFLKAEEISQKTGGAFDITVAPLVNAWGFGFKHKESVTGPLIDSLLLTVGHQKVKLVGSRIVKENPGTMLDASAIAKGYSVDVIAGLLADKGCENYIVEIGGEVVARGVSSKNQIWKIGINKPIDDPENQNNELEVVIRLKDRGLATSGNYRNFYLENGKKYAHTIEPSSGYPVQHNVLSASVLAKNCMTADAYATAFMVMGLEKAREIVEKDPDLEALIIYAEDDSGQNKIWYSKEFEKLFVK